MHAIARAHADTCTTHAQHISYTYQISYVSVRKNWMCSFPVTIVMTLFSNCFLTQQCLAPEICILISNIIYLYAT